MEAPRCRLCGAREWRHQCGGLPSAARATNAAPRVHMTVTDSVTDKPSVTPRDAPMSRPVTDKPTRNALTTMRWALLDKLAEIEAEIGPMTAAERKQRARRAKPKA